MGEPSFDPLDRVRRRLQFLPFTRAANYVANFTDVAHALRQMNDLTAGLDLSAATGAEDWLPTTLEGLRLTPGDFVGAAQRFERASLHPDAPSWLPRLAERMRLQVAAAPSEDDEPPLAPAEKQLAQLQRWVDGQRAAGRVIGELESLVREQLGDAAVALVLERYLLDAEGRVIHRDPVRRVNLERTRGGLFRRVSPYDSER